MDKAIPKKQVCKIAETGKISNGLVHIIPHEHLGMRKLGIGTAFAHSLIEITKIFSCDV